MLVIGNNYSIFYCYSRFYIMLPPIWLQEQHVSASISTKTPDHCIKYVQGNAFTFKSFNFLLKMLQDAVAGA